MRLMLKLVPFVCQTNGTSLSTSRMVLAVALLANRLSAVAWSSGPGVLGCRRPRAGRRSLSDNTSLRVT
jgi:hypothetical protein